MTDRPSFPTSRLGLAALLLVLLGACTTVVTDDIVLTRQSRGSEDWGRFFPDLYPGIAACLAAHPMQPAKVLGAVPQNRGMLLVHTADADGDRPQTCSIDTTASRKPVLTTPAGNESIRGPMFTPAAMPEPFLPCHHNEPVLARDGRLLGWLTYSRTDCLAGKPPQNEWRAFGNEPFWNLRILPGDITFDRLGEQPLRYPFRPGVLGNDRWTWILDAPDGHARDRLEIVISRMPCQDSMADRRYDFRAEAIFRGRSYSGCAVQTDALSR